MKHTTIARRSLLAGIAAASLPAAAFAATQPIDHDPVMVLWEQYERARNTATETGRVVDQIKDSLPAWTFDDPVYDSTAPGMKDLRWAPMLERRVTLAAIRDYNAHTESLVAGCEDDPEIYSEFLRRKAAGRARVRWWIAERRRQIAAQEAAGLPEAFRADCRAADVACGLLDRIARTPAASLAGVLVKLRLAAEWRELDLTMTGADAEDLDADALLMVSAYQDIHAIVTPRPAPPHTV